MTQRRRTSEGPTEDDAAEQQPVAGPTENAAPPSAERSARRQVSNSATNHDAGTLDQPDATSSPVSVEAAAAN